MIRPMTARCPNCAGDLEENTGLITYKQPHAGDLTLCCYCAAVLQFDDAMVPRIATSETVVEFAAQEPEKYRLMRQAQVVLILKAARKGRPQG